MRLRSADDSVATREGQQVGLSVTLSPNALARSNVLSVLTTTALGSSHPETIMGGVVFLYATDRGPRPHRPVASVMIPLGKLRCTRKIISGANVHLCHKIRTLIPGRPAITDVVPLNGTSAAEVCASAGSAERTRNIV
jgi:hypothetical protein